MKTNKKGFTLIELLAVIIILGILMIIAIPSVTTYIQNSRKSAYVDTASAYIDAVRTKVNEAKDLKFFDTKTLYLVPVGNDSDESCVSVESGGKSPFSDKWSYAFVGVIYKDGGDGYEYFFIGEDGAKQGLPLITQDVMSKKGTDYLYSSYNDSGASTGNITSSASDNLKTAYGVTKDTVYMSGELPTDTDTIDYEAPLAAMTTALTTSVDELNEGKVSGVTKVVVVAKNSSISTCKY